jgi:A/G-specific adenine glycosylase
VISPHALSARLLRWYDAHARELPWRASGSAPDPTGTRGYAVWISEVMLQQTRVETVKSYYARFLDRFPTVVALAEAPLDDVLGAWSGLGYYRRARALHAAAREVAARHGGVMPRTYADLGELPGVGAYTAGAVASIAFGQRVPAVDGNVNRVLSRLYACDEPLGSSRSVSRLRAIAEAFVSETRPGDHNQALMELGATICIPRAPRCEVCPLSDACEARRAGRESELPIVKKKAPSPVVKMTAALARKPGAHAPDSGSFVLGRRPPEGLFGGLWEPPMIEGRGKTAEKTFRSAGLEARKRLGIVRHVLTHRVLEVAVFEATASRRLSTIPPYEELAWGRPGPERGLSTLAKRILELAP